MCKKKIDIVTEWYGVRNAAVYMDSSTRKVRDHLKNGLRHARLDTGAIRIKKSWIDEYLAAREVKEDVVDKIVKEVTKSL